MASVRYNCDYYTIKIINRAVNLIKKLLPDRLMLTVFSVFVRVYSEDEFAASKRLWRRSSAPVSDMVKQLACDGFDLDLQPDDSDLDLIPPRPLNERRCLCCYNASLQSKCILQ